MAFPDTDMRVTIKAYLGADPSTAPGSWPSPVDLSSRHLGRPMSSTTGRRQNQRTAAAGSCTFWLDNDDGYLTPLFAASPYYGTWDLGVPVSVDVGNFSPSPVTDFPFFRGYIASIEAEMVPGVGGKNISTVKVTLGGKLRQIGQGSVAKSALLRSIAGRNATVFAEYWSMEGLDSPTLIPSGLPAGRPAALRAFSAATTTPFDWSADNTLPGSGPLPTLRNTVQSTAGIEAEVSVAPNPALGMAFWTRTTPAQSTTGSNGLFASVSLSLKTSLTERFALSWTSYPPNSSHAAVPADGGMFVRAAYLVNEVLDDNVDGAQVPFNDGWHLIYVRFSTSGSDVAVVVRVDDVQVATGTITAASLATVTEARYTVSLIDTVGTEVIECSVGHPVVMSGSTANLDSAATLNYQAGLGHAGETATARIARNCLEEGIPHTPASPPLDPRVGPQPIADVLGVLRDAETVGHGILYETLDTWGLGYRPLESRYNLSPAMTVDLATYRTKEGTSRDVLQPVRNDQRIRNEWTVSRPGGREVTRIDAPHQAKRGRYNDGDVVNVANDTGVVDEAGWRVAEGTQDVLRYQAVPIDLGANPSTLLPAWLSLDLGDRLDRTNHLAQHPTGTVSLSVEGYTARAGGKTWTVDVVAEPYGLFAVGELAASSIAGRLNSLGSVTAETVDIGETSIDVTNQDQGWSATAVPYVLEIGGEPVTVTAVSGSGASQTLTVTRTIAKSHPLNTPVRATGQLRLTM